MVDDCGSKDETPQLENGYVRFSTEWLEEFLRADYPGALKEFVFAVARETWGWGETWREITVPRLCKLLGLSVVRVKQLREEAAYHNLVEWEPGTGPTCAGRYRVQKDYRNWIPRRTTGSWAQRHGARATSQDVVTGHSALTGKDVLPSNRLGRANRSLYIGVKDIERKDLVQIGENDAADCTSSLDPIEEKRRQQAAIESLWTTLGLSGKPGPGKGGKPPYSAVAGIVAEHGLPMIQEYEAHCRSSGIVLPPGAAPWPWFVRNLREAMNQPWKWRDNGNGSGGRGPQIQLTELDLMQIQADREREEATRRGDQRTTDGTRDPRPAQ